MQLNRSTLKTLFAALCAVAMTFFSSLSIAAEDYPSAPVTLIVPYPPGGSADLIARLLGIGLTAQLKQTVVIKNVGGASGNIAGKTFKYATPDGYTLILGNAPLLAINPWLFTNPGFDPIKDFAPVTAVADVPLFLITNPAAPYKSVQEFVAWSKSHPDKATYASGSSGSTTNLAMKLFMKQAGFKSLEIPYKGSGPALSALAANEVPVMFELLPSAEGFIKGGMVNAIAVTSKTRQSTYPDIPTVAESGFPGFEVASWFGVLAPAGTSPAIIATLNKATTAAVADPQFKAHLIKLGAVPMKLGPQEFSVLIKDELQKWESIIKSSGVKIQ